MKNHRIKQESLPIWNYIQYYVNMRQRVLIEYVGQIRSNKQRPLKYHSKTSQHAVAGESATVACVLAETWRWTEGNVSFAKKNGKATIPKVLIALGVGGKLERGQPRGEQHLWFSLSGPWLRTGKKERKKVKSLSRVRLFATPQTVAYQAPPSMGFSRQEHWSGLPFPSPEDIPNPGIEPRSPAL